MLPLELQTIPISEYVNYKKICTNRDILEHLKEWVHLKYWVHLLRGIRDPWFMDIKKPLELSLTSCCSRPNFLLAI